MVTRIEQKIFIQELIFKNFIFLKAYAKFIKFLVHKYSWLLQQA